MSTRAAMRPRAPQSFRLYLFSSFHFLICFFGSFCSSLEHLKSSVNIKIKKDVFLPDTSPAASPQPFVPGLAPSPLTPFTNSSIPKLSGLCTLNFSSVESLMSITSIDCVAPFAPYLADVVCCPQLEATLVILIGQSSKESNMLSLNGTLAKHCLTDFQQILLGQGANDNLQQICSIQPVNLTEGSCPVTDVHEFEATVDTSGLLAACGKLNIVDECCEQVCQNAISEAAKTIATKAYGLTSVHSGPLTRFDHSTRINDCRSIVTRWLASKLDPSRAKEVLRGLSNCKISKVCPLVFPNTSLVINGCGNLTSNQSACCNAMHSYVSHLQKQIFVTNLQALDCAASLGLNLQKANVTQNVYNLCHISLKDFSVQAPYGATVSGCLLPSLPSDVVFDKSSGIGFLCDLNDNIPAPWPSPHQLPAAACNKTVKVPALPAAASGQNRVYSLKSILQLLLTAILMILL